MIAMVKSSDTAIKGLRAKFQAFLPRIERYGRFHFRDLKCAVRKADCIAETVALCWKWFVSLAERGKDGSQFLSTLSFLAARQVKGGGRLCGKENAKDVMNPITQRRHGFKLERLPVTTRTPHEDLYGDADGQRQLDEYEERLSDNSITPPPDQAAFRIDWPRFLRTLTHRDRELARFLSLGHQGTSAAAKFGLTPGRVTQLRQQWCREWRMFEGEDAFVWRRQRGSGKKTRVVA
jgi:hypothetical protein